MKQSWKRIEPETIRENPFTLIGTEWMLITAGTIEKWNTMTASWGGVCVLWSKNVTFCFVRPTRYTFEFMNSADRYTLSFFSKRYKPALQYCGAHSGRDVDKAAETGLAPTEVADSAVSFEQARLVFVCRKLHQQDIDPGCFVDETIDLNYAEKDYHRMYIGEVESCLIGE